LKSFIDIIKEYPLLNKAKVLRLLKYYDLFDILHSTYSLLNQGSGKVNEQINWGCLSSNFLTISYNKISSITPQSQRKKMESITLFLAERLVLEYLSKNSTNKRFILSQIEGTITTTCLQCKIDFLPYEKLLQYKLENLEMALIKSEKRLIVHIVDSEKYYSIKWLKKGRLFELVDILFNKKYIKRKRDVFAFFQLSKDNGKIIVHLSMDKKYQFVHLLYRLFNENFASITPDKGYFCCAEEIFRDMDEKPFKPNSFKKISSKINKDKEKYMLVVKEVDEIIKKITIGTNGL